jgi:hypothetical protein
LTAVITASYADDFERCQLLCESLDKHLKGDWTHYLLVEECDVETFSKLGGKNRVIVSELDLFPWWLRSFPDPVSSQHARVWLSPFSLPLRGWHAQQIRRLAIAEKLDEDIMLSIDSDVVLLQDFDVNSLLVGEDIRFYCNPNGINESMQEHMQWSKNAGSLLGIADADMCFDDYINTFIAWRTQTVKNLLCHIEKVHGHNWVKCLIRNREMSECMIYGRFAKEIEKGVNHNDNRQALCKVMWDESNGDASSEGLKNFLSELSSEHVAIGIQSFVHTDIEELRKMTLDYKPA